MNEELTHIAVELDRYYARTSPQLRRLNQVCDRLSSARSALDDAVIREHEAGCAHIYYPGGENWDVPHRCSTSGHGRWPNG
jgi:hypothetical protein